MEACQEWKALLLGQSVALSDQPIDFCFLLAEARSRLLSSNTLPSSDFRSPYWSGACRFNPLGKSSRCPVKRLGVLRLLALILEQPRICLPLLYFPETTSALSALRPGRLHGQLSLTGPKKPFLRQISNDALRECWSSGGLSASGLGLFLLLAGGSFFWT